MTKKAWYLICWFMIAALVLQGCGAVSLVVEQETPPLRVEWTTRGGDYTVLIAQQKGFFEKHGVNVEPVFYPVFSEAVTDITVNRIDVGIFALGDLFNAASMSDVVAVGVSDSGGTSAFVSQYGLRSLSSLRGKRIGVTKNTYNEMFVRQILKENGIPIQAVTLVEVPDEQIPNRLAWDLDAGYVRNPFELAALRNGHRILFSNTSSDSFSPDVIVFRRDIVEERPEDVRAFLNAWFEALDYRLANPDECNKIIAKVTMLREQDVANSGNVQIYNRQTNLELMNASGTNTIFRSAEISLQFLIDRGQITTAPKFDEIFDPSFLR